MTTIDDVGFDGPENLVYDEVADVFLVSNMGGGGSARGDNGFISRVSPDGRVMQLRWIAGGRSGVVLHAPKGLAIRGDTLAVADLGAVRLFDRRTGAPLDSIAVPGLVMNDLAFACDGSLWITDTGPPRDRTAGDTTQDMDAVWRLTLGSAPRELLADVTSPAGLAVDTRRHRLAVTSVLKNALYVIPIR